MSKKIDITFWRDEIEYDVQSIMSLLADSLPGDTPHHVKHQLQDVCQGENERRTWRYCNRAYQDVCTCVSSLISVPVADESTIDNTSGAPESYTLYMTVVDDWAKHQTNTLKDYAHDYIVYSIVAEWLALIMPQLGENFTEKMIVARDGIKKSIDDSAKIGRIKPYPY